MNAKELPPADEPYDAWLAACDEALAAGKATPDPLGAHGPQDTPPWPTGCKSRPSPCRSAPPRNWLRPWPTPCNTPTAAASCTATSSPPTSCCRRTHHKGTKGTKQTRRKKIKLPWCLLCALCAF